MCGSGPVTRCCPAAPVCGATGRRLCTEDAGKQRANAKDLPTLYMGTEHSEQAMGLGAGYRTTLPWGSDVPAEHLSQYHRNLASKQTGKTPQLGPRSQKRIYS